MHAARPARALLCTVIAAVLASAGCGSGKPVQSGSHNTAPAQATLTVRQACGLLRADLARNGGAPDIPALRKVADHVTAARLAGDARTAVRDIGHTGVAPLAVALLEDDCARAGMSITAP